MEQEEFEHIAQEVFDALPEVFQRHIENVHIVIENEPRTETLVKMGLSHSSLLLGLYEGVPLNKRGGWYGMAPVIPDKITLYKRNIERIVRSSNELREKIREVLIHEIAHYYGMNEEEVRNAGY